MFCQYLDELEDELVAHEEWKMHVSKDNASLESHTLSVIRLVFFSCLTFALYTLPSLSLVTCMAICYQKTPCTAYQKL